MVQFNDVTVRDGQQSLLAGRMRQEDILKVLPSLATAGFNMLEVWGGTCFDIPIRFKGEDPWQNLREIRDTVRKAAQEAGKEPPKLCMLLRGQNLVGYGASPDDVVESFIEKAAENGIQVFRIFDALNDFRNIQTAAEKVKQLKASGSDVELQATVCYTTSPVHRIDGFVEHAKKLKAMGCDSVCIKDMAGLLEPESARELVSKMKAELGGDIPITLHTHSTMGRSDATILAAIDAGIDFVDTASEGLSGGTGQSATETILAMLECKGKSSIPHLDKDALKEAADILYAMRPKYAKWDAKYDAELVRKMKTAQVPGGMTTTLLQQIREQLKSVFREQFNDALVKNVLMKVYEEIPIVREELGWPPLVTPASQVVAVQAACNVIEEVKERAALKKENISEESDIGKVRLNKARYRIIPDSTKKLILGQLGQTPAEPAKRLVSLIEEQTDQQRSTERSADSLQPKMDETRTKLADALGIEAGDVKTEDVLTVAMFDQVGLDHVLHREGKIETPKRIEPIPTLPERQKGRGDIKGPHDIYDACKGWIEKRVQLQLAMQRIDDGITVFEFEEDREDGLNYLKSQISEAHEQLPSLLAEQNISALGCLPVLNTFLQERAQEAGLNSMPKLEMKDVYMPPNSQNTGAHIC